MVRFFLVPLLLILTTRSFSQEPLLPPGDKKPFFKLEAGGPTSSITSLAFDSKGTTLYVGGFDKVVRRWIVNAQGRFVLDRAAYRVPIGPGNSGAINAIALSDDDALLAAAGRGPFTGEMSEHEGTGEEYSADIALNDKMLRDEGVIHVFDTKNQVTVALLRGHVGPVLSLAFAPARPGRPAILLSAGSEWNETSKQWFGTIRVWDVTRKLEIAKLAPNVPPVPLGKRLVKPALAVWHTGLPVNAIRAAIAWEDGRLRVWDVDQGNAGLWEQPANGQYNGTATLVGDRLLTSRMLGDDGSVEIWDTKSALPGKQASILLPLEKKGDQFAFFFPLALAPFAIKGDGTIDRLAIGVAQVGQDSGIKLRFADLVPQSGVRAETVPLWKEKNRPILASSPRGKYLAAAGNDRHEVLVFAVADLLKAGAQPIQRIGNTGLTFSHAVFATKDKSQGVILKDADRQVVLDFTHGNASTDISGWTEQTPSAGGWTAERSQDKGASAITVKNAAGNTKQITIGTSITALALLQPAPPLSIPWLAVATLDRNLTPELLLFDAASGEKRRRCLGHSAVIRSLAFSADGRLLVSASDDETVCVWSLTDLPNVLGQHGALPFKPDIDKQSKITVSTPGAATQLQVGAVISGLVDDKGFHPTKTLREIVEAAYTSKPGEKITLRVDGKDVPIALIQQVDVRSPLFSLFMTRDNEWIGWNPIGAFESSGKEAERHLGWHFNTGQPNAPTRFAAVDQYRKEYFRRGLLKELIERGELRKVPDALPLPAPRMTLLIEENDNFPELNAQKQYVVRHDKVQAHVAVFGRPLESLERLTWQMDDGAEHRIDLKSLLGHELPAIPLELGQGAHTFRVRAFASDLGPMPTLTDLVVVYQPAPRVEAPKPPLPSFVIAEPHDGSIVDGTEKLIDVKLTCGLAGSGDIPPFDTSVVVNGKKIEFKPEFDVKNRTLKGALSLEPGANLIEVRLSSKSGGESAARTLVTYVRPPQILELTAPAETKTPAVGVLARIWSPVPLQNDRIRFELNGTRQTISAVTSEKTADENIWLLKFKDVLLQGGAAPKQNAIRLWVGNAEADCRKPADAAVLYKPEQPPPVVEILEPTTGSRTTSSRLPVRFMVRSTTPLRQVRLLREGSPPLSLDLSKLKADASGKFELKGEEIVKLAPAFNHLRLEAVNDGGQAESSINVNYIRMPVRLQITEPADGAMLKQSRVTVRGKLLFDEIDERDDPRLSQAENVRVFVNGFLQPPARLGRAQGDAAKGWERPFEGPVLLNHARDQENVIKVALANFAEAEGPSSLLNVRCLDTEKPQRIHLLVISPEENALDTLKKEFAGLLKGFAVDPQHFLPAEDHYLPGDDASLDNVLYQLVYTRHKIDKIRSANAGTDLLMLYYRGTELVSEDDHVFRLKAPTLAAGESRYQLRCASLAERFAEIPGAQILLLDVRRQKAPGTSGGLPRDLVEKWADFANVELKSAVMRYAWFGASDTPSDARLIKALEEAMPKANKLIEVSQMLGDYPALRQIQALRYTPSIHSELGGMLFGSRQ